MHVQDDKLLRQAGADLIGLISPFLSQARFYPGVFGLLSSGSKPLQSTKALQNDKQQFPTYHGAWWREGREKGAQTGP